jgi:hypothetical protein
VDIWVKVMTIGIKERLDQKKIIQSSKEGEYLNCDKTILMNSDHPLEMLVRMKQNLFKAVMKNIRDMLKYRRTLL